MLLFYKELFSFCPFCCRTLSLFSMASSSRPLLHRHALQVVSRTFALLMVLMPLEAGAPDPLGMSEELSAARRRYSSCTSDHYFYLVMLTVVRMVIFIPPAPLVRRLDRTLLLPSDADEV